ncbi:Pyridoxal phosphate-dependent transferase [Pseudocohnilembus persalinus]|uniref:Pyridoxal phosphate-dependent transferase n=1 Tax=Pseudocohnilembus persalinus TaxID=266149 RepID=A0A0V0QUM6_PSEPJ|nr:Pyridoxal phosphate-dependent transferase [Pseudocohnilembus persalinus]|eukprot:KRX05680.1 Pyridoxal phosphate-dependent transferase [Pseudocohnilembus persalinus]
MIKITKFAKESGSYLTDAISEFKIPQQPPKDKKKFWFLSGDMTMYGHKNVRMAEEGYEIVRKTIENPQNHQQNFSHGSLKAREKLAQEFSTENIKLTSDDVILTHGVNVGLIHSILCLANEGDNILIPEPSYPFYQKTAKSLNVEAKPYKLLPEKDWEIDLGFMEQIIDEKTKFIWVVNPSNPCGSIFSKNHMYEIFQLAKKHNKILIFDEVYFNESFEGFQFTSASEIVKDQPLILLGGMEKTFCVPGWCVSWAIFYDPKCQIKPIIQAFMQSNSLIATPPEIISNALPDILDKLTLNFTKQLMPIFKQSYDHLLQQLTQIKGLKPIEAKGTFYLSVLIQMEHFPQFKNDQEFLQRLLEEQNIFLLSLNCFGGGQHGFRMMMAAPLEYYDGFYESLSEFCLKYYC